MGDPVVYFEIMGGEGPAQQAFYAELFGWDVQPVAGAGGYARVGGAGLEGAVGAFPQVPAYVTVYVQADDPAAALARAEALGASVMMAAREVAPGVTAAMFRDPAGNAVGLISGVGSLPTSGPV